MGQKVKPTSMKVSVRLKDSPSESFTATCDPVLIEGWLFIETDNSLVRIPKNKIIRYSVAEIMSSPLLDSDPDNGQYSGMHPSVASAMASKLTQLATETGQTEQLYKHLSVLLPLMNAAHSYG